MIVKFLSIIKSFIFCLKAFSLEEAIKLPVLISWNVRVKNARRGCVEIPSGSRLKIGFSYGSFDMGKGKGSFLDFRESGKIIAASNAIIPAGSIINVQGTLFLGRNFESNANLKISCGTEIHFGDDMAIGWNVTVIDGDGHDILVDGVKTNNDKPIFIGNHVWLCAESSVLKGVTISDHSVVAYGGVVSKNVPVDGSVIVGNPGRVVKENVDWRR